MVSDASELTILLNRASGGDRAAFDRLYEASSAKLFGVVLRITRDRGRAEEVIQEAYVKIWRSAGRFDPDRASPITWMATIARNTAIDSVRRLSREAAGSDADMTAIPDKAPLQDAALEAGELQSQLHACLETLEPAHRDAVKLAYLEGLSRQELADRLAMPVGTIKTWLHRSLKRLKDCLLG